MRTPIGVTVLVCLSLGWSGCFAAEEYPEDPDISGLFFLMLLPRFAPYRTTSRIRDLGDNTVVYEETEYGSSTRFRTVFLARKCLQGFQFDALKNRCRPPAEADVLPGAEQADPSLFQYCSVNNNSCNDRTRLSPLGASEAYAACTGETAMGLKWSVSSSAQLGCILELPSAAAVYEAARDLEVWVNESYEAETANAYTYRPDLKDPYMRSSHAKVKSKHVLCTTRP